MLWACKNRYIVVSVHNWHNHYMRAIYLLELSGAFQLSKAVHIIKYHLQLAVSWELTVSCYVFWKHVSLLLGFPVVPTCYLFGRCLAVQFCLQCLPCHVSLSVTLSA
ncbi:hypothetical protein XELAEV_18017686mg [Xenopus laevis]|uniref:Uncharacterized protein n=1 Tax=Xenopus laevis TaxID=8355 RepID=A0A974DCU1_XENLA|nr:hypothetical protein XELAEV_18017686mg [Xenopus laevis]